MKSTFLSRNGSASPSRSADQKNRPFIDVQAKLSVGKAGDKFEREADSVADQVVQKTEQQNAQPSFFQPDATPTFIQPRAELRKKGDEQELQKQEEQETIQEKPLKDSITSLDSAPPDDVQPKCDDCGSDHEDTKVQTKCADCASLNEDKTSIQTKCEKCAEKEAIQKKGGTETSANDVESSLKSSKGGGSPMSKETQSEMGSAFGADLSGVRIHTDTNAVQMNRDLGARAFTNGNDVYFNQGEYNPGSKGGKHLLAHELTHTFQQGQNQSNIQKAEDPCAAPKEKGSKAKAASKETAKSGKGCSTKKIAIKKPSENQKKPEGEDKARDISSKEGSSVNNRQTNAPPADKNAPKDEKGIKKQADGKKETTALDPCALREQKASQPVKGKEPAKGEKQEKKKETKKDGKEEKGGEKDFVASIAQKGISPLVNPNGDGEKASPKVLAEGKKSKTSTAAELLSAEKTKASLKALTMSPTAYRASKGREKETAMMSGTASSFLSSGVQKATGILDSGLLMAENMRASTRSHKKSLQKDISVKRKRTSAFFSQSKAKAKAKAQQAKAQLSAKHTMVMMQIEMTAMLADMVAVETHKAKQLELETTYQTQLNALNTSYVTGYNKLIASGNTMGGEAQSLGNTKATDYKKKAEYKYEGFWDGYVTYNRQMARVKAAKQVGKQYKEGMQSQAKAQADKMNCGKAKDHELMAVILQKGSESLQCALLNSQESIQKNKEAATLQATYALAELTKNIDNSLDATLNQLEEKKAVQLQLINDYGIRQSLAIDKDGELAITNALVGINKATKQLFDFLREYKNTVERNTAPDSEDFMVAQDQIQVQFETAAANTNLAVETAVTSSNKSIDDGATKAQKALNALYKQGRMAGRELVNQFNTSIDALVVAGTGAYDKILLNGVSAITAEQQNAVNMLTGIVTGISGLLTKITSGVDAKFTEADTKLKAGMKSTIDKELADKICAEAEKAAKDVKPWWVSALKVLLVIIVIVVVALVIGPAIIGAVGAAASALAGSLGAGAALAGTIGAWAGPIIGGAIVGALAGATIQVGNNLIDIATSDKELSWENVKKGVAGAMIAGAIGGALGGFGGQFAQVLLGRFGGALGPGMKFASDFGINMAFDFVGGVLGDLAAGNPITLEGILLGMAIGGAVQISMGGLGAIAKNSVDAPKLSPDGTPNVRTGAKAKVEDFAAKIQDFQGKMMEGGQNFGNKAGFGKNAPTADATSKGIVDANNRMQDGEFFPSRPAENAPPKLDADTDVNAPKQDGDTDSSVGKNDASANNKKVTDPDAAPENPNMSQSDIRAEQEWIDANPGQRRKSSLEGYTDEVELPNGHIWRKNKSGGWCRFSEHPLLSRIPHELFTMNLDIMNLRDRYIVPGNVIHQQLMAAEQQLRAQFKQSTNKTTRNRNVLSTSVGFVITDGDGNYKFVVFDPQKQFQSGLGIKTSTRTKIVHEMDPNILGADSTTELPSDITEKLTDNDPKVVAEGEKDARKSASSRARGKDSPLTLENSRMGVTSNTTTSLDFHSERAFYEWLRKNPNLFADAISNLGIDDPVVKAVVIDMASTRYVCPRCALAGTNLVSSSSELDFMTKIKGALNTNMIGVDADMSLKIRASAEILFPVKKVMPALSEFQDILRMNTGVAGADFPVGTTDYDLLKVALAVEGGNQAEIKASLDNLRSQKPTLYNQLQLDQVKAQFDLSPNIEGLRILTPMFCGL